MCDQSYGAVETAVSLGTGLYYELATAYTVDVNDVPTGFVTDAAQPEPMATGPALGEAFELTAGETVDVGDYCLAVEFVELMEDPRCPSEVTWVCAGRIVIRIIVSSADGGLRIGTVEFTLKAGPAGSDVGRLYDFALYPVSTIELTNQDYVTTLESAKIRLNN